MPAALTRALLVAALAAQGAAPLRKTDLARLLAGNALSQSEIAAVVRRSCLAFTPTARDRRDLSDLGAGAEVMASIDACAAAPRRAPPPKPAPRPAPPPSAVPSPDRTGFVGGMGQRGTVGDTARAALVFEVRDLGGRPIPDMPVSVTAENARLLPYTPRTDAAGRVSLRVVFGTTAGRTIVRAAAGMVLRTAVLYAQPGRPARFVVARGAGADTALVVREDSVARVRVMLVDAWGNAVPPGGFDASAGDDGVARIASARWDSTGAALEVAGRHPGRTVLHLAAPGFAGVLPVTVTPRR